MKKPYYGWVVLAALTVLYFASNGYGYLSIPVFYPKLTEFFHAEKGTVPQAASIITLILAFISPVIGWLLDRYNVRVILTAGILGMIATFFYFTKIQTFTDLKIFNTAYSLALCFGGIVTSIFILNKWFDKNRGIALGIFLNSSSLGAAFFNKYIGNSLTNLAWQEVATKCFYITTALLLIPLFFIKVKPSEQERLESGEFLTLQNKTQSKDITLNEALKTKFFWLFLIVSAGLWFCIFGIIAHKDTFLKDLNLTSAQAGSFGGLFFLSGVIGKLTFGFLSDKFNKQRVMIGSIACILAGSILLKLSLQSPELLPVTAIIYGIGYSGTFTMIQLLIAEAFMGKSYGTILGIFIMADTLAGSAGIYILGSLRKSSGDYGSAFLMMMLICVLAMGATFFVKNEKIKIEI